MKINWKRFGCNIFGHDYFVVQKFSSYSRRVGCTKCDGDWAMNDEVRCFLEWSSDFEDMYKTMGKIVLKR